MATPTTYTRTYTYTGQDNQTFSSSYKSISKSSFKVSGNTTEPIGKITKITFTHRHTSTKSSTNSKSWSLKTQILMTGKTITSNTVTVAINGTVRTYMNTFSDSTGLPTPEEFNTWSSARIVKVNDRSDSELYWRATTDYPITIVVYFWSARDLVSGEAAPTVGSTITITDAAPMGSSNVKAYFGNCVQGKSDITITGTYTIDTSFEYISATHSLTVSDSDGNLLYTATQTDNNVFHVGVLDVSGTISIDYTVTDNGGLTASKTYTATIYPYNVPTITGLQIQRFTLNADSQRVLAEDGEYVLVSFTRFTQPINGKNALSLTYTYTSADGLTTQSGTLSNKPDGETLTYTDFDMFSGIQFDPTQEWTFDFSVTDKFTTATASVVLDEAGAFGNMYPDGFAVGMRGTGTENEKKFEVAETHETHLYGGLFTIGHSTTSQRALGIQVGEVASLGGTNGGAIGTKTVTFPQAFAAGTVPVVLITFNTSSTAGSFGRCCVTTNSITNTGFQLRFYNGDSSSRGPSYRWIAVGVVNS